MRAEIIAVGTELLIGQIANTNAQEISEGLASIGVDVHHHVVVGDNQDRIAAAITNALDRSDVVIVTGGLGPTHDDLTREAISAATSRPLARSALLERWVTEKFERMGRPMAPSNLRQADVPQGATTIDNPRGTAPGFVLEVDSKTIFAVPGVPAEMKGMLESTVLPSISKLAGQGVLFSRVLKAAGVGESDLANRIDGIIQDLDAEDGPKIALLASPGEVKIRISVKASDRDQGLAAILPVERNLKSVLGSMVFGSDSDTLESVTVGLLKDRGLTLAVAESFTGGHLISRLVDVPGVSDVLRAGYVTYSPEAKIRDLGVAQQTIDSYGAVSAETVLEMAQGAMRQGEASVGIATTGEAGPNPNEAPVGTMYLGLAWEGGGSHRHLNMPGHRHQIRRWGTQAALNMLRLWLLEG